MKRVGDYDGEQVGRRIRELRDRDDVSQRELAEAADISIAYVSRIESGTRHASDFVLRRFASRLGTSTHYLITGEPDTVDLGLEAGGIDPRTLTPEEREMVDHDIEQALFKAARGLGIALRVLRNEAARAELETERRELERAAG